jgi:glycerate-2-kinase
MFEGESRELARALVAIARQILSSGHPVAAPCVLIGGGETTVSFDLGAAGGLGGPNQEFATSAAIEIDGLSEIAVLGVDTDGTDGPTPYCGGLVDGSTVAAARMKGIDLYRGLAEHDVSPALMELSDLVITGATGTNVNDLKLVVVAERSSPLLAAG